MQRESDTLVGLSVGTSKISVIVAEPDPRSKDSVRVLGVGYAQSRGLSKGIIVNLREAAQAVRSAFREAENIADQKIDSAIVAFNSLDVESVMTDGMVALGGGPRRVDVTDLDRAIEAARSRLELSKNSFSVHTIPVRYALDGRPVEPLNMTGMRLEMVLQTVSIPRTYVQNVLTCVESAGVRVSGLVLKPLASSLGSVQDEEMQAGCIAMAIGGGSTSMVLYQSGRPFRVISIPIGGNHITSDLATVLRISMRDAESVKKRLYREGWQSLIHEGIDTDRANDTIFARVYELFSEYVSAELADVKPEDFPAGIILSGGVAMTPGIDVVLSEIIRMKVRIATPKEIFPMPPGRDDASYASAAGLLRYIMIRRKHSHFFIEPSDSDMVMSSPIVQPEPQEPIAKAARMPDSFDRSGDSDDKRLKTMMDTLLRGLKDLF